MFLYRRPRDPQTGRVLHEEQFESAEAYLARERRVLFLKGPIMSIPGRWDDFSPTAVHDAVLAMNYEDPTKPIYIVIDSMGGSIDTGWTLYDVIRMSKAEVVTIGQTCGSMATVILAAGHRRLVYPHATIILHLPQGEMQGDPTEMAIRAEQLMRVRDRIVDAYLECGATKAKDQILEDIDREFWLDAQGAVEYGLADGVVQSEDLFGRQG